MRTKLPEIEITLVSISALTGRQPFYEAKISCYGQLLSARARPRHSQLARLCVALNTIWEGRPCRGPRNKDRKLWAKLVRIIQSANSRTNNVVGFEILHVVNRRVDKQAATAASAESTIDPCAAICDHFVALGGTPTQVECASRPTNNRDFVSASEILAIPAITEILPCRLGRELVGNFSAPAPSRNNRVHVTPASESSASQELQTVC